MRFKIIPLILILSLLLCGCAGKSAPSELPTETTVVTEPPLSPEEQEALRVADAVKSTQSDNSFTFLAFADIHANVEKTAALQLAGEAAAQIRNLADVDFAALLGGIAVDASQFQLDALQCEVVDGYLKQAFSNLPTFVALGEEDSFPVFPNGNPSEPHVFQDLSEHKIRVITLNTADTAADDGIGMSAQQLQWFAEALDLSGKADADDWGILILSHTPLDFGSLLEPAGRILDAYLTGTAAEFTWEEQIVSYSFEGRNAAEIIANIHGHTHNFLADNLYVVNQQSGMYPSPIVRISIPNASDMDTNRFGTNDTTDSNGIEYGEAETYDKVPGAEKATAFNVVTVDRAKKVIYCTNYGAGYDREISYGDGLLSEVSVIAPPEGTYTNQVPISTEFGRRNNTIFSETGYRNHTYLVCNDIDEEGWPYGNDAEYVTTGAIPFTVPSYLTPPVIYIWGAELDEADHTRFFIYDSQKYRLVLQATGAEFKNYFTIEELGDQYYKLTPIPEGKASVLFPATNGRAGRGSIAFSLKGRGENLVITVGEPIIPE